MVLSRSKILVSLLLAMHLPGCFGGGGFLQQKQEANKRTGAKVLESLESDGVVTAAVMPDATETQIIQIQSESTLKGTTVAFPPGTLAVATNVSIQEGASIATPELATKLGVTSSFTEAGAAVVVASEQDIDAAQPFTISIPLPATSGLFIQTDFSRLVVVFKIRQAAAGKYFEGLWPKSDLTIENGQVKIQTKHFGSFQAAYTSEEVVEKKEVETTTPIVTKKEEEAPAPAPTPTTPPVENDPIFNSLLTANDAADGYIGSSELSSVSTMFVLDATEYQSATYTDPLLAAGLTCDSSQNYKNTSIPTPAQIPSVDGVYAVCIQLKSSSGEKIAYGKSANVTRDTVVPTVVFSGAPTGINDQDEISVTVTGVDAVTFQYKVGDSSINCTTASGYSTPVAIANPLQTSLLNQAAGDLKLCVIGNDAAGNQSAASQATWTYAKVKAVKQLATGKNHTCALFANGKVKCWGDNTYGQLGYGDTSVRGTSSSHMGDNLSFVSLGSGKKALELAAGDFHTCAILDNHSLKCWGRNQSGQLGYGDTSTRGDNAGEMGDSLNTVNLGTSRSAIKIAAGAAHTCALLDNHNLKCWGDNSSGQIGSGATATLGDNAGEMGDSLGAVDLDGIVLAVASRNNHNCVVLKDHTVKCWGDNTFFQLGLSAGNRGTSSSQMGTFLPALNLGTGKKALQIALGAKHSCALLDDHTVKCWGYGGSGQLGTEANTNIDDTMMGTMLAIDLGLGRKAMQVAANNQHTCAILDDSTVKCWGMGSAGQLGQGNTNHLGDNAAEMGDDLDAINLGTGRLAIQIAAGALHTCALLDNSSVKCWGNSTAGEIGLGTSSPVGDAANEMGDSLPTVDLGTGGPAVLSLASGDDETCAILDDRSLKCWGYNFSGQVGLENGTSPVGDASGEMGSNLGAINLGTTGHKVLSVTMGGGHVCALMTNHKVKCWGSYASGQLGYENASTFHGPNAGTMGDNLPFVNLGTGRVAVKLALGDSHTCAVLDDSSLKCWGSNTYGQLGLGDTTKRGDNAGEMGDNLPAVDVGTGLKVVNAEAGAGFTCATFDNHQVKCWGNNTMGQLGTENTTVFGDAAGEMGDNLGSINLGTNLFSMALSAGINHVCSLINNFGVKCWGRNASGENGVGGSGQRGDTAGEMGDNLPAASLGTGKFARQVASGFYHTCALTQESKVRCWGWSTLGRLGTGVGTAPLDSIGDGPGEMGDALIDVNLGAGRKAFQLVTMRDSTCVLTDIAQVKCWGKNTQGQLGLGDTNDRGDDINEMGDNLPYVEL